MDDATMGEVAGRKGERSALSGFTSSSPALAKSAQPAEQERNYADATLSMDRRRILLIGAPQRLLSRATAPDREQ